MVFANFSTLNAPRANDADDADLHHAAALVRRPATSPTPTHPQSPRTSKPLTGIQALLLPNLASLDAISRFLTHSFAGRANMATKDGTNVHTELRMMAFAAPTCANNHQHAEKGQEVCIGGSNENCWCRLLPGFCSVSAHLRQRAHEPQSGLAMRSN